MGRLASTDSAVEVKWSDDQTVLLPPTVNVHTVPVILKQVAGSGKVPEAVDFSAVKQADSVALALLLTWQSTNGTAIRVKALPEQLVTLLHLYDLEDVLALSAP